jgi:hypothetical protein
VDVIAITSTKRRRAQVSSRKGGTSHRTYTQPGAIVRDMTVSLSSQG